MDSPGNDALRRDPIAQAHLLHTREKLALLDALKARFGPEVAEIVARTSSARAFREWRTIGAAQPARTARDLVRLLWEPLRAKGFVFETAEAPDGLHLRCTRCPIADMARALEDREWLFHLACGIDDAIAEGFNPELRLRRTRTLMEGHDCCDHVYFTEETPSPLPE
jgi:predicted ArsR family transcriptional regulator